MLSFKFTVFCSLFYINFTVLAKPAIEKYIIFQCFIAITMLHNNHKISVAYNNKHLFFVLKIYGLANDSVGSLKNL